MIKGTAHPMLETLVALFVREAGVRTTYRDVMTDGNGRYSAEVPANSRVFATVWGRLQPCVASVTVDKDATLDLQLFPAGTPVSLSSPAGPTISGVVYEKTPNGRRPLRGATAWLDISVEAYVANTVTDDVGRFVLCGVTSQVRMDVFADGFEPYMHSKFVSGSQDESFEFEFTRQ